MKINICYENEILQRIMRLLGSIRRQNVPTTSTHVLHLILHVSLYDNRKWWRTESCHEIFKMRSKTFIEKKISHLNLFFIIFETCNWTKHQLRNKILKHQYLHLLQSDKIGMDYEWILLLDMYVLDDNTYQLARWYVIQKGVWIYLAFENSCLD